MSMSPCRKAAWRIVSSSSTSISRPTGSKRTVCVFPIAEGEPDGRAGSRRSRAPAPQSLSLRSDRRATGGPAALVLGHVGLALLGGHLVEEHVGRVERDPADLVQRPH